MTSDLKALLDQVYGGALPTLMTSRPEHPDQLDLEDLVDGATFRCVYIRADVPNRTVYRQLGDPYIVKGLMVPSMAIDVQYDSDRGPVLTRLLLDDCGVLPHASGRWDTYHYLVAA